MGRREGRCVGVVAALAIAVPTAPVAHAGPAEDLSCATLAASTTGLPEFVLGPTLDLLTSSGGELPARVNLRTTTETFNTTFEFVARAGGIAYRKRGSADDWRALALPACFAGHVRAISADGPYLVAVDDKRRMFTMDNANRDPLTWNFTSRWGPPLWVNPAGQLLPKDTLDWQLSVLSSVEDRTWTDPAGHEQTVGGGNVTTVYALRADRRRITLLDPWLPNDYSYEVCGPHKGRLQIAALAASGSTLFVSDRFGDLYTRLWDFDTSGADNVFFRYSYEDQRGVPDPIVPVPNYVPIGIPGLQTPPIQLPASDWVKQPKIDGQITDVLSVSKDGPGSHRRVLRVEGRDAGGHSGYWHKQLAADTWSFQRTDAPLAGATLENALYDRSQDALGKPDGRFYRTADGVVVPSFKAACTPTTLRIKLAGARPFSLTLHTVDALRQDPRGEGLDGTPRQQLATIEVPPALRDQAPAPVKAFLAARFPARFTASDFSATAKALQFPELGWTLTRAQPLAGTRVTADRRGRITVTTTARSDGTLQARGVINGVTYGARGITVRAAGAVRLRFLPRSTGRRLRARHRTLRVPVTITFTPVGGDPQELRRVVRVRGARR
jgi:hypothetical protein